MGAALVALAALEIAVRGRGAALARRELVGVHRQAHRAARLAPFEAGGEEDLVEAFGLGLLLHQARARHDHGVDALGDLAAGDDLRRGAQVLDAAVGARADEDAVDGDVGDPLAALQAHVVERALDRGALGLGRAVLDARHEAADRRHVLRAGAPGDDRRQVGGVEPHDLVEMRALVGAQRVPIAARLVPQRALGRIGPAFR